MANKFVHIELNTDDPKKAKAFYKKLFSWKLSDMKMGPGMTYTMVDTGSKETGGGIFQKPMPDAPTAWLPYVEVKDVPESITKARKLGARILVDYAPIPGMGSYGVFIDPTGAPLGLWSKKQAKSKRKLLAPPKPRCRRP
ncbi:MAG: VOC family protein [Myxococcaceae bacterium]